MQRAQVALKATRPLQEKENKTDQQYDPCTFEEKKSPLKVHLLKETSLTYLLQAISEQYMKICTNQKQGRKT